MVAILKVWRQIQNPTLSIDAHLFEEQSCKVSSYPIWNDGELGFWRRSPQQEQEEEDQDE